MNDKPKLVTVKFTGDWEYSAGQRFLRGEILQMPIVIIKDKRKRRKK